MNKTLILTGLTQLIRFLLTILITFFATKHVLEADVASKLMRGDTVPLWHGALPLNIQMVENFVVISIGPLVINFLFGLWSRVKLLYAAILARSQTFAQTEQGLQDQVKTAGIANIISTVATSEPPKP